MKQRLFALCVASASFFGCGGANIASIEVPDGSAVNSTFDGAAGSTRADGGTPTGDAAPHPAAGDAAAAGDAHAGEGGLAVDAAVTDGTTTPIDGATAPIDGGDAAATPTDAGADAASPGEIVCGAALCDAKLGQFCCVRSNGNESCETSGNACANAGGVARECDKAADCTGGGVCCYDFSASPPATSCRGDCNGGGGTRVQACRTQGECTGGTCAVHACIDGGSIETCAAFAPECP
jgi:hypothetical protein